MTSLEEKGGRIDELPGQTNGYLQEFTLYETCSNFYMVGWSKNRIWWRVLKIDRLELCELNVSEDSTTYSNNECHGLLRRIHEGNVSTGGLKFVTSCYGIIGFIKFLGPYYMLLITKRMKIGTICGHTIYSITKTEMITIPNSTQRSNTADSKNENRYKKLLRAVDLTKDFFFSYSYNVMYSLQKNLGDNEPGKSPYESMFVWNEFLTRGVRKHLKNTLWTVALTHGFFKQVGLSTSGKDFTLTLVARRSRHYAGTRYLKRGVNEKGRVANDVETEQIVFQEVHEGCPMQISSVVQNRGSIPLFWSQETSRLHIKPDIILSRKDQNYEATTLHFGNLVKRYGNPIIILNLIKTREKRPRESILRTEFANAIEFINKDLLEDNRLRFLHWDLNKYTRNNATNVLILLGKVAAYALHLTGILFCQMTPTLKPEGLVYLANFKKNKDAYGVESGATGGNGDASENCYKAPQLQKGVLRTNCIDCLDRTNVAQYAYGLVALGHQLHALGLEDGHSIDLDTPLADDLMGAYEAMGDTLANQYGGSAAHNKIFSERRGQWKAATQSQELIRSIQRYYNNAYLDHAKQDAINVPHGSFLNRFLGYFQPQQDKPALWELNSDQHFDVGRQDPYNDGDNARSIFKRSLSDGNIHCECNSPIDSSIIKKETKSIHPFPGTVHGSNNCLSNSSPEKSTCESDISYSRYIHSMSRKNLFMDMQREHCFESGCISTNDNGDSYDCSNFLDFEWLSSSGYSCEEDAYERSTLTNSSPATMSLESLVNEQKVESATSASECGFSVKGGDQVGTVLAQDKSLNNDVSEFSDMFVHWVNHGEILF